MTEKDLEDLPAMLRPFPSPTDHYDICCCTDCLRMAAAEEIERLRADREKINVAVTRRINGYKSDAPIWYTVDHIAEVLKELSENERRESND